MRDLADGDGPRAGTAGDLPAPLRRLLPGARSWLAIPLTTRARRVGLLVIGSTTLERYAEAQVNIGAAVAGQGMIAYDNALLFTRVQQLATTDGLTDVPNRRHFFELAADRLAANRTATGWRAPVTAVMLDIDHFKQINDRYGHGPGDEVIVAVAARIKENMRGSDLLCRYGGEEFAMLLDGAESDVTPVAERLRTVIADAPVPTTAGPVRVTVSIGTSCLRGDDQGLDTLLTRADQALYEAKQSGRNRVVQKS